MGNTKEYNHNYYLKNKKILIEKMKSNCWDCPVCNHTYTLSNKKNHEKSKKHQLFLKINELQKN